ncbi:uncharacterized protein EI90DRAFT_3126603 [Cantharellus anzutake]|uniref:uncharacterized protein n=1 Tax=Cantharellus anzutake TaxID=1750568 RepID=UPI001906E13F|nr:uncharacterized protein EI90DRAFT_3126603 [Cantharellus anzutake]KAF8327956.1 hypothetical protein EI90DRAFT_3126603 [Cantharellus anzutake]
MPEEVGHHARGISNPDRLLTQHRESPGSTITTQSPESSELTGRGNVSGGDQQTTVVSATSSLHSQSPDTIASTRATRPSLQKTGQTRLALLIQASSSHDSLNQLSPTMSSAWLNGHGQDESLPH